MNNVVEAIKIAAEHHGLTIEYRKNGAKWRTVHLAAPAEESYASQHSTLTAAKATLIGMGVSFHAIEFSHFDNPPCKIEGKEDPGHPRHRDPILELDSVWWDETPKEV